MKTKKEFRYFTIFNHKKEESYLRDMHKSGWRFVKVSGLGMYHFEECTPEDVVYQLDCNPQTDAAKEEYITMFADCGWEYIQDYSDYSYFRKRAADMREGEEIFNDEDSRTAMMGRVYKSRLRPLLVIFTACLLPQFCLNMANGNYMLASFFGGILLVYVAMFFAFAGHYYKMKHK